MEMETKLHNSIHGHQAHSISEQGNYAIKCTQFIDKDVYRLQIDGMVERPVNLTCDHCAKAPPNAQVTR